MVSIVGQAAGFGAPCGLVLAVRLLHLGSRCRCSRYVTLAFQSPTAPSMNPASLQLRGEVPVSCCMNYGKRLESSTAQVSGHIAQIEIQQCRLLVQRHLTHASFGNPASKHFSGTGALRTNNSREHPSWLPVVSQKLTAASTLAVVQAIAGSSLVSHAL